MPTPIVMPQMGESIAEGTIVRWIKKVGDTVDRDEPLFEISTDKVDAEIPSPAAGVLTEIKVREGETVPVNAVVGTIGQNGESPSSEAPAAAPGEPAPPSASASQKRGSASVSGGVASGQVRTGVAKASASTQPQGDGAQAGTTGRTNGSEPAAGSTGEDSRRQKSSPLVRRIARDHDVDITRIHGSGIGGRVTKHDILGYLEGDRDSGLGTRDSETSIESRIPDPGSRIPDPEPRLPNPESPIPNLE